MFELRAKTSKETDILMYGSISEWGRVRCEDFIKSLSDAKAKGYEKVNLKINSPGGSIFEGLAIMSQMISQEIEIKGIVEGIAASMGSAILQGCHKRAMVRGTRLMVHQGSGGAVGSANFIRDYADLLDSFNRTLAEIYARRTVKKDPTKDAKWILANWMAEGKDTWFTAEKALAEGLIDEIVEGNIKPLEKENASLHEMAAHYDQFFKTNTDEMKKEELIKLIPGLKAEATDAEVLAAVEATVKKAAVIQPSTPGKPATENEVKMLEVLAAERGMTDEKQLASLKKLAAVDLTAAMDMLPTKKEETKNEPISINELIAGLKSGASGGAEDRKSWGFRDWEAKDPKGFAALLEKTPKEYIRLFKAEFGVEPTEAQLKLS